MGKRIFNRDEKLFLYSFTFTVNWVLTSLDISGYMFCYLKRRKAQIGDDAFIDRLIGYLKERMDLIGFTGGSYHFRDGAVSPFQPVQLKGEMIEVSLRFEKVNDLGFLRDLFEVGTREVDHCNLNCSLRGRINFDRLKGKVREYCLRWLGESEGGSFSSIMDVGGQIIRLTAYPEMNVINVLGEFRRGYMEPDKVIRSILMEEPMVVMSVRIPPFFRESCLNVARKLRLDISHIQRMALRAYLESFYREEIERLIRG